MIVIVIVMNVIVIVIKININLIFNVIKININLILITINIIVIKSHKIIIYNFEDHKYSQYMITALNLCSATS